MKLKQKVFTSILFIFCFTGLINSQNDFKRGYIVTLDNDTVYGKIALRGDKFMSENCLFKESDSVDTIYKPNSIAAYKIDNGKYFVSKNINDKYSFLETLVKGKLSIYYLKDHSGNRYFVDKEKLGIKELPYKEEFININGSNYKSKSIEHMKILANYTSDAPDLKKMHQDISQLTYLNAKGLIRVAEKYQSYMYKGNEEPHVIFKSPRKINWGLEAIGGLTIYKKKGLNTELTNYSVPMFGVQTRLWLPRESTNLYFRTGIIFTPVTEKEIVSPYSNKTVCKNKMYFKVPIFFEYYYHKDSLFRPRFGAGLNIYNHYQALGFIAGTNIRLKKLLYCSVNYEMDFSITPNSSILPLMSNNFYAGLYYAF